MANKKKKRRLRKPIRITLWALAAAMSASVIHVGLNAVSQDEPAADLSQKIAKTVETVGGVDDLVYAQDNTEENLSDLLGTPDIFDTSNLLDSEISDDETSSNDEDSSQPEGEKARTAEEDGDDSEDEKTSGSSDESSSSSSESSKTSDSRAESDETVNESAAVPEGEPIARILVDPGHGGSDPGMVTTDPDNPDQDLYEKDVTLQAAYEFKEAMEKINPRITVEFTRNNEESTIDESTVPYDEVTDLTNRVNMIDQTRANYFLSLHCNSSEDPGTYGYEMYIKPDDQPSADLTEAVSEQFDKVGWSKMSAVITTDYYPLHVVSLSKVPSMLVEIGYMSNPDELKALTTESTRSTAMRALAQAYSDYIMNHQSAEQSA